MLGLGDIAQPNPLISQIFAEERMSSRRFQSPDKEKGLRICGGTRKISEEAGFRCRFGLCEVF
jgi:hypothetical protein